MILKGVPRISENNRHIASLDEAFHRLNGCSEIHIRWSTSPNSDPEMRRVLRAPIQKYRSGDIDLRMKLSGNCDIERENWEDVREY